MRALLAVALADWRERLRRPSFLVAMGGGVYFGYLIEAGYVSLSIENKRGIMNSAWVGTMTALALGAIFPIIGFYLVKNALARDRQTGVGEILAASPVGRLAYIGGKALSNFLFLAAVAAVPVGGALLLQLTSGEDRHLDVVALVGPVFLLTLPTLAIVAAFAVLFESLRFLRGTFGNVAFFVVWMALMVGSVSGSSRILDVVGAGTVRDALFQHLEGRVPAGHLGDAFSLQIGPANQHPATGSFIWDGLSWSAGLAERTIGTYGLAIILLLAATFFFDRFDPARIRSRRLAADDSTPAAAQRGRLRLPRGFFGTSFGGLVMAELRLMLEGRNLWWTLTGLGLVVACCLAPLNAVRQGLWPVAWLWPLACWSDMGCRESRSGTGTLIYCSPRSLAQQALAIWTAGVLITIAFSIGVGVRLAATGDVSALLAYAAGCFFIPSLALALGSWSGGNRIFECAYLLLWYIGPMNQVPSFDYMGVTAVARSAHYGTGYLAGAALLLALAILGRRNLAQRVR
jgi:ABC-type transport system involved in multi-copper enzyme maturation permease subunit